MYNINYTINNSFPAFHYHYFYSIYLHFTCMYTHSECWTGCGSHCGSLLLNVGVSALVVVCAL